MSEWLLFNANSENLRGIQEWTIQRNWQQWVQKTKTNKTRQSRETDNNENRKRTQIKQDNPEKLTTMGTENEDK